MLENYFGLSGMSVLITGATGGIGTAITEAFAAAGAKLYLTSHDPAELDALCARFEGAVGWSCDVQDTAALEELAARAHAHFGKIDMLICNAGISGPSGPMGALDFDARNALLAINLLHPLSLAATVAPLMAEGGGGSIILTSSIAGIRGNKGLGLYGITKAALMQLARNLAVEWGPLNIRANAVAPGLIATDWAGQILSDDKALERRMSLTPLRRVGEPWEIAAATLFLAGPGAAFITRQTLVVDGGTVISDGN